jgi:hypothetical protein
MSLSLRGKKKAVKKELYLWMILAIPPIVFMGSLLMGANGLGCSEYSEFRSNECMWLEEKLGFDLYWPSAIAGFISFPISLVTMPILLVLALQVLVLKSRAIYRKYKDT